MTEAEKEREAIVAWLRDHFTATCPKHEDDTRVATDLVNSGYGNACINIICAIERGDHLQETSRG